MDEGGERKRERRSVKLLCTSLTSWTESAQLLKREMGKTDTHTKASLCLAHNAHPPSLTHLQINLLTYNSEVLNPRLSAPQLSPRSAACELATCVKAPDRRVDLRLVSDSPQPLAGAHAT